MSPAVTAYKTLDIVMIDAAENQVYCDNNAVVVVGLGHLDSHIEKLLVRMTVGETLTVSIDALSNDCYKTIEGAVFSAGTTSVYQYVEEEETEDFLAQQNFLLSLIFTTPYLK